MFFYAKYARNIATVPARVNINITQTAIFCPNPIYITNINLIIFLLICKYILKGDNMKLIRTSFKNKGILIFLISIFLIGFIFGFIYYFKLPLITKTGINENLLDIKSLLKDANLNYFFQHNIIFTMIFFLSFTVILFPFIIFYLFYEGVSLGFSFIIFFSSFKMSGLIYSLILFIITKLLYLLFIFYLIYNSFIITKTMILLILKKNRNINITFKKYLQRLIILIVIMLLYDVFIYFLGSKILCLFKFLLK